MPSKADQLEAVYGDEVRQLALTHTTARRLKGALEERRPPLYYTDGVLKQWLQKYGSGSVHATLSTNATLSAKELHERYGDVLHAESRDAPTAYKLQKALARRVVLCALQSISLLLHDFTLRLYRIFQIC